MKRSTKIKRSYGEEVIELDNYIIYHLHSDLSNGVTNIDSMTKYYQYVERAKECGMRALGFAEHGSVFEWYHKKEAIEAAGMKYIHGIEAYVTKDLFQPNENGELRKVRDNMHCVLMAKNYDGVREINRLSTKAFNRNDGHYYHTPRITLEELFGVSENIIITSACVGGILGKGDQETQDAFLKYMSEHSDRCFLEIGHHRDQKQVVYNKRLVYLSKAFGIPLIAGTDTHALNEDHAKGRSLLQKATGTIFEGEENWDLKFKTLDELIDAYRIQKALPYEVYIEAIQNTNLLYDMVEDFELDRGTKYPHIYDNPDETFYAKIKEREETHPYALKNHSREELDARIDEEFEVYQKTGAIDFMLLQSYIRDWESEQGIQCGYGRGSVSGSMIAYILGITQMDSMRYNLNFFRFLNPSRVTNADIDTDYDNADRDKVKEFLLRDKMDLPGIHTAGIVTFNTIDVKGAVKYVIRALYKDDDKFDYIDLTKDVASVFNRSEEDARARWPDLFELADLVSGTIVSVGEHPSGVLISDLLIEENIGLFELKSSEYPVTMLNMKELDALMYVKLDALGLDNIGIINETCKLLGIDRLNPDNTDMEDVEVWKDIRDDTTVIFQWESDMAQSLLKRLMSDRTVAIAKQHNPNFSYLKWFSFGNGLLRPGCASFRDKVANGDILTTGFKELDDFLSATSGRITMQEDIMRFLVLFCGYSGAESDTVRRGIAKKSGTEQFIDEIHERFIEYSHENYGVDTEKLEEIFPPIKQGILDATRYAFSWNHSDAYSCIGYICGYLRHYYPIEFITSAFNIFTDNTTKTAAITTYAKKCGIEIELPKWGISKAKYFYDKEQNTITKNLTSVKGISAGVADALYDLAHNREYTRFMDVLYALRDSAVKVNKGHIDTLIKIDFFSEFGNQAELLRIAELYFEVFKLGESKELKKEKIVGTQAEEIIKKYANGLTKDGKERKSYLLLDTHAILNELEDMIKTLNIPETDIAVKIRNFDDLFGYPAYVSGKEEERKVLYILDCYPVKRKKDGKKFAYSVTTKSIGSGKESRFTVVKNIFECKPIQKGDIIHCNTWHRNGKYFILETYDIISKKA